MLLQGRVMHTVVVEQSGAPAYGVFPRSQCATNLATVAQLGCIASLPIHESTVAHPDMIWHGVAIRQHQSLPMLAMRMHS